VIPSRLQRYVLWEIIPVIGICAVALTAIFFLGISVSFTREGLSVVQIYYVVPYILMMSLPYALPASFLLAAVLVFGRLSSRHEIDAVRANGVNVNHIVIPPLVFALAVCWATFFMNHYFFPWTLQRVTGLRNKLINDVAGMVGQGPKNGYRVDPYYIYVGGTDPKDHSWRSVALIQFADEIPSWFVWAKRGVWKLTDENNASLALEDGVMMEPRLSAAHLEEDEKRPMVHFKRTTLHIPLNASGGPSLKPKFLPLGALLRRIREGAIAAAETRAELGRATEHPKTEFWRAKAAFGEADQKYAALAGVSAEKKGKRDEARAALDKLDLELRADQVVQENARKRCDEAKVLLANQTEYSHQLQSDIQSRSGEEAEPEELAPIQDELARINERMSQLTKRVADSVKELEGATSATQAADARHQAAAAAFAAAEADYNSAQAATDAAATEMRRLAAARDKLDGVEQWIDARSEYHFRNAGSATCFIFMLLGIPLGILARRGSFTVALAISFSAVLFIHYPLMMIGETLADDGYLAPWIAEWMANALLGCAGLGLLLWGVRR
jgi:lipopolysaccharide export LptBFGC system permease protein LptF